MLKNLKAEVEHITGGKRFVDSATIADVMEIPGLYLENCGPSGTGKGTLWTAYRADRYGNPTSTEIAEMVEAA